MTGLLHRPIALVIAILLPPLGVWLIRGRGPGFWTNAVLFLLAQGVFWGVMAAPGLLLWLVAILQAIILVLMPLHQHSRAV